MKNEAREEAEQGDGVDAPCAAAAVKEDEVRAESEFGGKRPPEVDAAGEGELEVAAEDALLDAAHQQEGASPERGIVEDLPAGERDGAEMEPSAPGHGSHQQRERRKPRGQTLEKVERAAGASEIEGQEAAAALDERHDRRCAHHAEERDQLAEEGGSGREMVFLVDKMKLEKRKSHHEAKEGEQEDKSQHRPAGAQALAAQEHPAYGARFPGIGGDGNGFGSEGCLRRGLGGGRFRQSGLNLWLHGVSLKSDKHSECRIVLMERYLTKRPGGEFRG